MLISHKYKFIYIKCYKVGGTSTESFLERYCLHDNLEKSHTFNHETEEKVSEYGIIGTRSSNAKTKWFNHKTPKDIKNDIGDLIWNSYMKISNVRNPYDIAVSFYYFHNITSDNFKSSMKGFETYLDNNLSYLIQNKKFWKIDDKFSHDFYIKQENLKEGLLNLIKQLNLPQYTTEIPQYKVIPNRPHYSTLYNDNTKKLIEKNFGDVLEHFQYKFEKKI